MKINEIMNHEVQTTSPQSTTRDAARLMHDKHVGALPVVENDKVVGFITDRDICCKVTATGRDAGWTRVSEVMGKDVATCYEDQDISDAAAVMREHHIRRLAVLNRDNRLIGFVSVDDIAHKDRELASDILEAAAVVH